MARVRISISLESDEAERIRMHADRAGMDVSSYLVNAAVRQMAEADAAEAQFAALDALIADSDDEAEYFVDEASDYTLGADEQRQVDEAMHIVFGGGDPHPRGEVA